MENVKVTMLGTGSPWPDMERSGPSQLLWIDELPILIDCGEKTTHQLKRASVELTKINHLFFTHLHADHILGYGQFLLGRWFGTREKLTIVGPKGTRKFHEQILNMYKEDIDYKLSLGRPPEGLLDTEVIEIESSGEMQLDIPAKVSTAPMVHSILTYAYRFDTKSHAVVFSGDTAPTEAIVELAREADTLIQDSCLAPNSIYTDTLNSERTRIWKELQKEHCDPEQAAQIAHNASVKQLILTHFLPGTYTEATHLQATKHFSGETIVPNDLQEMVVPSVKSALEEK